MKIGEVDKVEVVGEVSNRLLKSAKMVGIWGDREGMIRTLWDNYKKNELENVLNVNRKTEQDLENYKKGILSQDQYENGTETISWVETYTFFPCLHDLPNENPGTYEVMNHGRFLHKDIWLCNVVHDVIGEHPEDIWFKLL